MLYYPSEKINELQQILVLMSAYAEKFTVTIYAHSLISDMAGRTKRNMGEMIMEFKFSAGTYKFLDEPNLKQQGTASVPCSSI